MFNSIVRGFRQGNLSDHAELEVQIHVQPSVMMSHQDGSINLLPTLILRGAHCLRFCSNFVYLCLGMTPFLRADPQGDFQRFLIATHGSGVLFESVSQKSRRTLLRMSSGVALASGCIPLILRFKVSIFMACNTVGIVKFGCRL